VKYILFFYTVHSFSVRRPDSPLIDINLYNANLISNTHYFYFLVTNDLEIKKLEILKLSGMHFSVKFHGIFFYRYLISRDIATRKLRMRPQILFSSCLPF